MPEQRTLDNPNDAAIREQQAQQRLAHGKALAKKAEEEKNPPKTEYEQAFHFRFRRITNGSFAGLWELCVMSPQRPDKVDEQIFDANALPECLDAIGNIFANRGM